MEAFGEVAETGFTLGDVLVGEIIRGFRAAKEFFVVGDPVVLGFHGGEELRGGGLLLNEFFDGVG